MGDPEDPMRPVVLGRAADGSVAGTMRFDLPTRSVTIECDGRTWEVGPEDECPSWFPEGVACQPGVCPDP